MVAGIAIPGAAGPETPSAAIAAPNHRAARTLSAVAVAAGLIHTCVLTGAGGVKCWGYNGHNELGDDTTVRARWTPVDVSGLEQGATAIAAGLRHTCALTTAGGVKCWGYNSYGQLGDGTTTNSPRPVEVTGLRDTATAIAAAYHTCALTTAGRVECWGLNDFGQLGDGTTDNRSTPVDVYGLSGVVAIAVGSRHSCALTGKGGVKCWGDNSWGQLGDGTTQRRSIPVDVSGLSGVVAIAVGSRHSCALTGKGGVKCWGDNSWGQLGDGTTVERARPVGVSGLSLGIRAIAADRARGGGGDGNTCALASSGGVECWGNNSWGQLGDGSTVSRRRPVGVSGLSRGVTGIDVGGYHSCARTADGGLRCWGLNLEGGLGDGTTLDRRRPVDVVGFAPARSVLSIASRSVRVIRRRIAPIALRCGIAAPCREGRVVLSAAVRGRLLGSPRSRVNATLGRRRFAIAEGRTATVDVALTTQGLDLIVRMKRLRTEVHVSYRQPTGGITVVNRAITLIAPTPHRARH